MSGIGVDVCSVERIKETWLAHGERFLERLLTSGELAEGWDIEKVNDVQRLARRWALKEAVAKALGTGIGEEIGFQDILVGRLKGAPVVTVPKKSGVFKASVSDDAGVAVAFVVWENA